VGGTAVDVLDAVGSVELVDVVEVVSVGVVVEVVSVPVVGGAVGGGTTGAAAVSWFSVRPWNETPARDARALSWTMKLACSESAGTAFPRTTSLW
jgi:hypothetical protein